MTWRVVILAFTIMLAGATAPVIRDAVGGRAGYRVMGLVMAAIIVVGVVGAYVGTRRAPIGRVEPGAGTLRDQAAHRGGRAGLPAAARHVRRAGAGDRVHARRRRLPRRGRARPVRRHHDPVRLLRRTRPGADARMGGAGRADRQAHRVLPGLGRPVARGARLGDGAVGTRGRGVRRGRGRRLRLRGLPGLPPRDAAGRGGRGRAPDGLEPGRRLHRGVDRGRDPRPRARAGLFALVLAIGGYESSTTGDVVQSDTTLTAITYGFSVLPAVLVLLSLWSLSRYRLDAREVALAEGGR